MKVASHHCGECCKVKRDSLLVWQMRVGFYGPFQKQSQTKVQQAFLDNTNIFMPFLSVWWCELSLDLHSMAAKILLNRLV